MAAIQKGNKILNFTKVQISGNFHLNFVLKVNQFKTHASVSKMTGFCLT
jgi:hypothetical protein